MKSIPPLSAFLLFTLPLFAADPAGQVEENRRIKQEIRNLEARWTEQANANKQRERENRNLERVIAQQQAVIAEIGAQPKGAAAPGSSAVWTEHAAVPVPAVPPAPADERKTVYRQKFDNSFRVADSCAKFASIRQQEDGEPALAIDWPAGDGKTNPCVLLWLKSDGIAGEKVRFTVLVRAENISKPSAGHLGGKFGLMVTGGNGKVDWPAATIGGGSFGWKPVSFTADIPYGVRSVAVLLGLQGVTGKIQFRDLKAELAE